MRIRCVLIPSIFLVLLLPLTLVSCGGGGTAEAPPSPSLTSSPPAQASVIWGRGGMSSRDPAALFLSQTDGSGVVTLADEPGVRASFTKLVGSTVFYQTQSVPFTGFDHRAIWRVEVTGTGRQALAQTVSDNILRDVVGPWVVYDAVPFTVSRLSDLMSVHLSGTPTHVLAAAVTTVGQESLATYEGQLAGRVVYQRGNDLFSLLPNGTDLRQLTTIPRGPNGEFTLLGMRGTVGMSVIYAVLSSQFVPDLFAVPVTGGAVTTLAADPDNDFLGGVVGTRVVYHRCPFVNDEAGPCDLYSVESNGSATVALSTNLGNEFVAEFVGSRVVYTRTVGRQRDIYSVNADGSGTASLATNPSDESVAGMVGSRVIFRRTIARLDDLYSRQADGTGGEIALATFPEDDSFAGVVGARVIFERVMGPNILSSPRALYSVQADGSGLVLLTTGTTQDEFVGAAGDFACFERTQGNQRDLWCVPADGSAPAQPVATTAADEYFVTSF